MKLKNFLIFLALLLASASLNLNAQLLNESDFALSTDYTLCTSYVWRGFELDEDPVIQTGLNIGYKSFSFSVWNSQNILYNDRVNSDEVDYIIDYSAKYKNLSYSLGNTFYTFPNSEAETKEAYINIGYDAFLSPSLSLFYDYGDEEKGGGEGQYYNLSLNYPLPLQTEDFSLSLDGSFALNNELFIDGTGSNINIGATFSSLLYENLRTSVAVNYSIPFLDLKNSDHGNQKEQLYGCFNVQSSF
ncbi:MAG: TorF family putative porin [Elusimicrobiota bacterium]